MRRRAGRGAAALVTLLCALSLAAGAAAQEPGEETDSALGCRYCVGVRVEPSALEGLAAEWPAQPTLLRVRWQHELGQADEASGLARLRQAGAVLAPQVVFRTAAPLLDHATELEDELRKLAAWAAELGPAPIVQVAWSPDRGSWAADDYAFLLKRASVVVTGASADAQVVTEALPVDAALLRALYEDEIAAYVEAITLQPGSDEAWSRVLATITELDPGRSVHVDGIRAGAPFELMLSRAAERFAAGVQGVFFAAEAGQWPPRALGLLRELSAELAGDVEPDPYTAARGARGAWTFVRGEDLSLRLVVESGTAGELTLEVADASLRQPSLLVPGAEPTRLRIAARDRNGISVAIPEPPPAFIVRLERPTASELEGIAGLDEELTVADARQIPVSEILRRLQAFEDRQDRRLANYTATNTSHMRFALAGVNQVEITFRGDFFYRRGAGFDWAWQEFLINGVRWRGKRIPEIPLIQPEKAAALPLQIHFTEEYRYRLRGTASVRGRDCWVVDFRPLGEAEGRGLHQGTVWIDREHFARVRTRAVQVGLEGDVLSNEETIDYSPLSTDGSEAAWGPEAFYLPTHVQGQQLFSILNSTTVVETETELQNVSINPDDFEDRREVVLASEATMVRDTDLGLRYLVTDKDTGERVVEAELRPGRLFGGAGIFYDDSFDYPLPLAGIDYFSFDFKGTGNQVNVFFAGAFIAADIADPDLFGSRWDAGLDLNAIAFKGDDEVFRDDREVPGETVETRPASLTFRLGRPLGSFTKLELSYDLRYRSYDRADDTDDAFAIPSDHLQTGARLGLRYNRSGWRLRANTGSYHRSDWDPWGFDDNADYSAEKDSFSTWGAGIAKSWHFKYFQRLGAELEYVDGSDLDRFSKYEFGFFSDIRVHGYQSDKVRAEKAWASHLSYGFEVGETFRLELVGDGARASVLRYGFEVGETFRLELVGDGAWATDEATGLDQEFLAGVGIVGTVIGPWQTIVNLDLGVAVAGPDDGVSVFVTFLKLFNW